MTQIINRAEILVEALPYIQKFSGQILVIKFGGSVMVDSDLKAAFAKDMVLLRCVGIYPIVVHGGGKEISHWMNKMGKKAVFIDGYRFTDSETMEITEMVLTGKISNQIVEQINKMGGKAIGLSGKSANLFTAKRIRSEHDEDLGFVGQIESIDETLLKQLVKDGYIPVISSVGLDKNSETLNLNADNVAYAIASHLKAQKLIYLTDVDGVLINDKLQHRLSVSEIESMMNAPNSPITGGMRPKLACATRAIQSGVSQVHIINGSKSHSTLLELLSNDGVGTLIEA